MKKPETKFRESTYSDLNSLKNCFWESIQQKTIRGSCDIIACINGLYIGLEYKKDAKTEPNEHQKYKHHRIRTKAKGKVFVVHPDNWQEVFSILKGLDNVIIWND